MISFAPALSVACIINMAVFIEMVPEGLAADNQRLAAMEPSLYLCLRVGQPINTGGLQTCPIESYSKKKRPEYWFSIPRDKYVYDYIYNFFILDHC